MFNTACQQIMYTVTGLACCERENHIAVEVMGCPTEVEFKGAWSDCFRFFYNLRDFGIRRKLDPIFSLPLANFTSEKCTVWKISYENVTSYDNHN